MNDKDGQKYVLHRQKDTIERLKEKHIQKERTATKKERDGCEKRDNSLFGRKTQKNERHVERKT